MYEQMFLCYSNVLLTYDVTSQTLAVFSYTNQPMVTTNMRLVRDSWRSQATLIEYAQPQAQGLSEIIDEFVPDYLHQVEAFTENWVTDALQVIEDVWADQGQNHERLNDVLETIRRLRNQIQNIQFPTL